MKKKVFMTAAAIMLAAGLAGGMGNGETTIQAKKTLATKQYTYKVKGNSVTIKKYIGKAKKVTIPSKIKGKKVTEIGSFSFARSKITSVKIPNTVKKVSFQAFAGAKKLKKVTMSDNVKRITDGCFSGCVKLEKINIPKKMKSLGDAFENCKKLKSLSLPDAVTTIPYKTFYNCTSLTKVKLGSRMKKIDIMAFAGCENLTSVGDITVDDVGQGAFTGCRKLGSRITISEKCKCVGRYAFQNCEQADIVIPETLQYIGEQAFANCKKITSITIPDGCNGMGIEENGGYDPKSEQFDSEQMKFQRKRIGRNFDMSPYAGCSNVSKLIVKDTSGTFVEENGILYNKDKTAVLYVLPSYSGTLDFLKQVDTIAGYAMTGFKQKEITVPDNVKTIWDGAFYGAESEQIHLGKGVKELYDQTFAHSAVTSLVIPEGIEKISDEAISYCTRCKSVSFPKSLQVLNYDFEITGALRGLSALEKVEVADGNASYHSKDGMLFRGNELICYPAARKGDTYTVPKDITLGGCAFDSLQYLKKIVIPQGAAAKSGYSLMVDCKDVTIQLPKSFTQFPSSGHSTDFPLFRNCKNCKALVYKNSAAHKYCKKQCSDAKKYGGDTSMYAYQVIKA